MSDFSFAAPLITAGLAVTGAGAATKGFEPLRVLVSRTGTAPGKEIAA